MAVLENKFREIGFANVLQSISNDKSVSDGISGLMLLFYFDRRNISSKEGAFEFSHRTFGEYFAGVKIAEIITAVFSTPVDPQDVATTAVKVVSSFGPQHLEENIVRFIMGELQVNLLLAKTLQTNMSKFFPSLIAERIDIRSLSSYVDDKTVFRAVRNAELLVFVIMCQVGHLTSRRATVAYSRQDQFSSWLNKEVEYWRGLIEEATLEVEYSKSICNLDLTCMMIGTCLNAYLIENCTFTNTVFEGSTFDLAHIENCLFTNAKFDYANFSEVHFRGVVFDNCSFNKTSFHRAVLDQVRFTNCRFDCILISAKLTMVEFVGNCKRMLSVQSSFDNVKFIEEDTVTMKSNTSEVWYL